MRVGVLMLVLVGCSKPSERVTLYSAQDREFAEPILAEFEARMKLSLSNKFDTEAQKSVSLANELIAEAGQPRCDVHWNNEPLNTIRLARKGVYEMYRSPAATDFPDWTRPSDGRYQAFAARARVLIVNTNLVVEAKRPKSILDLTRPEWRAKVAMAKPMFGTTATHSVCLFEALGTENAREYFSALKANNVAIVAGNKQVAVSVASGNHAIGFTDTDDAILELNAGKPVAVIYPDREANAQFPKLGVLYLPNTLALVKGSPNPAGGRKLIDYLLGCDVEERLARGGGFQIPLNPALANAELHPALLPPTKVKRMDADFEKAADRWDEVQAVLRDLFAQ